MKIVDDDLNDTVSGWIVLDSISPGRYDLLLLQNGIDTLLAWDSIPSGQLTQIRLILGPDNYVVVAGKKETLKTPSAQQSGLKLQVNYKLEPGLRYEFWLDFDADKSIVKKGNGGYNLQPVIRVFTKNSTGSIDGYVNPPMSSKQIYSYNASGTDTVYTSADINSGYFLMVGLDPGSYTVKIEGNSNFKDSTIQQVNVSTGIVTHLDTISL